MTQMTKESVKSWVPPIIRGMTSDGETALVVTVLEDVQAELQLPLHGAGPFEIEELAASWRTRYSRFCAEHARYPRTIGLEGISWSMGLGISYDEAVRTSGVSKDPAARADNSRGAIMKRKVSLVTGGAQGFGEGIVRSLVAEGGYVYIADLNAEGARTLALQLNSQAGSTVAFSLAVNVTDEDSVRQMMDSVASTTGSLDLFVSNAGVLKAGSVKEMSLADFQFVTSVDYTGFFLCTKFAARQLALQNIGSDHAYMTDIVAISSKSGLEGSNKNGAYAGAKFGTIGLTQSFALELVTDNIKVNAICPGNFLDGPLWSDPERGLCVQYLRAGKVPGANTVADVRRAYESKVPLNRGCRTEDVVRALCYIVEQKYETGQAVPVTGGQVMLN
ncbi:MAG: SDR family NAD(P)-dependent oxidoreductase [Sphaerochaetaceae bacterium]|nr:SDR family NAD(P)-dependent oxidoreductase [Sphaerochaetaceae bacterium]